MNVCKISKSSRSRKRKKEIRKEKKIHVIDMTGTGKKGQKTNAEMPKVIISRSVYLGIVALRQYCSNEKINDVMNIELMSKLAKEINQPMAADWIYNNTSRYLDGICFGFQSVANGYDSSLKEFKELKDDNDQATSAKDLIIKLLSDGRGYKSREEIERELRKSGLKERQKIGQVRKYITKIVMKLRKEGYDVVRKKDRYVIKGVTEELLRKEKEMAKKTKKKVVAVKVPVDATEKPKKAKKVKGSKEPKKTKKTKKEADDSSTIVNFVLSKLGSGESTKQELAEAIIEAGLTQSTEVTRVIKYLNLMFYKLRKRGVPLKQRTQTREKGGGFVGYYSLK